MDTSFPPSPPPPELRKQSPLGTASFIMAIVAAVIICGDIALAFGISGGLSVSEGYTWIDTALTCVSSVVALTGLGLGIAAVAQKNTKKVFGILGIIFNALIVLGICSLIGINIISLAGNL
jgi:hypothetical protein